MLCTYNIYVYGWMYYWALCLSTSLKLISLLSKKAWQSNLCIITPIWESPRGPDTKKYGSCAKILSGSWYMSFPGFWYKLFGVLIQNHRGADTKPPGCCYKNHRGPMPGVSGYQRCGRGRTYLLLQAYNRHRKPWRLGYYFLVHSHQTS